MFFFLNYRDENEILVFEHVATFALGVLSIPISNATPERTWSKLNNEKTRIRNSLSFHTVRDILLGGQYVKDQGGILSFQPTDEMIEQMKVPLNPKSKENKQDQNKEEINENDEKDKVESFDLTHAMCDFTKEADGVVNIYGDIQITFKILQQASEEEKTFKRKYSQISEKRENKIDTVEDANQNTQEEHIEHTYSFNQSLEPIFKRVKLQSAPNMTKKENKKKTIDKQNRNCYKFKNLRNRTNFKYH